MTGVVRLSFVGADVFLPSEEPVDRQYLVDYVAHVLHSKPKVQIVRSDQRWMAERRGEYYCCAACGRASKVVCRKRSNEAEAYCLHCALETEASKPRRGHTRYR